MSLEKGALGNAIREARIEQHLSQEEFAEMIGITPTHLKHIESEHRNPSIEVLFKIAEILHMSIDNIIFYAESSKEEKISEIQNLLTDCSMNQLQIVLDLLHSLHKNIP
ncbi:MAG: helix-turn-helix transcriptional regulator [Lachnospiraceae bacterium]|nr:helix-turn-helix transcriptional regulator [Lachnospiraceae bacterium]MDY5556005.1 helix-turn-helix transcriptional regulator [Blautia sp.]